MPQAGETHDATRFDFTEAGLEAFFRRYEAQRLHHGVATTLHHVSPGQRIDAITAIVGLNKAEGWRRQESDTAKSLWLRYITPVLAEARESAAALAAAAVDGLPGVFVPPFPEPPIRQFRERPPPRDPPPRTKRDDETKAMIKVKMPALTWRERLAALPQQLWQALRRGQVQLVIAAIVAGCALAGLLLDGSVDRFLEWIQPGPVVECAAPPCTVGPDPGGNEDRLVLPPRDVQLPDPSADDPVGDAYRMALVVTLAAAAEHDNKLTPRMLAEIYAGESDVSGRPELFLAAMLKRRPDPVDDLVLDHPALLEFAAAFAAIELGTDRVRVQALNRGDSEDRRLGELLNTFIANSPAQSAHIPSQNQTWPAWLPYSVFILLLPALLLAAFTYPAAVEASLANPPKGIRGKPFDLPLDGLVLSTPRPDRRLARSISWREPVVGRRMHADRSIRATLAAGGFLSIVMRKRTLLAEYVFLVRRPWPNDHEAARVSRLIDTLSQAGANLATYDYDPDPRTISARQRDERSPAVAFDLRGLRERHPDARLVLVTDGNELVDYFTLDPLPFVADELARWPGRMLLTPIPVAEWGEREMKISRALDAPIGRASAAGFQELAAAFGERRRPAPRRIAEPRAADDADLIERIVPWLVEARRRVWAGPEPAARPAAIRLDEPFLRSDVPPSPKLVAGLVDDLHGWLGARGFYWLAACAQYPELRFPVTTYLGWKIAIDHGGVKVPLYDEDLLAQLTLLPWFRSGHMPPWLGKALLAALTDTALAAVRQAVDAMLNGEPLQPDGRPLPKDASLPIWLPGDDALAIPLEAVVANVLNPDPDPRAPKLGHKAMSRLLGPHRRHAAGIRALALAGVVLWCAAAWWLWPDPAATPHGQGAWLPLAALLLVTAMGAVGVLLFLRPPSGAAAAGQKPGSAAPGKDATAREGKTQDMKQLPSAGETMQPVSLTTPSQAEATSEATIGGSYKS
ncbi:hypothetical protein [Mesorhizobium sp. M0478]|uniref:hypothetical protein n=1 Tax=Mesorhizobium sp. M0478 TaxID=2956947 RepID=UPI00333E0A16